MSSRPSFCRGPATWASLGLNGLPSIDPVVPGTGWMTAGAAAAAGAEADDAGVTERGDGVLGVLGVAATVGSPGDPAEGSSDEVSVSVLAPAAGFLALPPQARSTGSKRSEQDSGERMADNLLGPPRLRDLKSTRPNSRHR